MRFKIRKDSKIPVYCQIADWIAGQIEAGNLKEGDRLPAERQMGNMTGAARDTVKRAYEELVKRGCIITERGSGSYVRKRELDKKRQYAGQAAAKAVWKMKERGIGKQEAKELFLDTIWRRLSECEKIQVAWVDCNVEHLQNTAKKIEKVCNVRVTPLLLEQVKREPGILYGKGYDMVATTASHFDDLKDLGKQNLETPVFCLEVANLERPGIYGGAFKQLKKAIQERWIELGEEGRI